MDSRQLRYFIAVYEQRNLSRAADQVNVAQSALSHHISNLEAEFATPLFERKSRGVRCEPGPDDGPEHKQQGEKEQQKVASPETDGIVQGKEGTKEIEQKHVTLIVAEEAESFFSTVIN